MNDRKQLGYRFVLSPSSSRRGRLGLLVRRPTGWLVVGLGVEGQLELLGAEVTQLDVEPVVVVPVDVVQAQGFDVGEVPERSGPVR